MSNYIATVENSMADLKKLSINQAWWLMPIIPAMQEVEIRRIMIQG
jgi:hypothetical protein